MLGKLLKYEFKSTGRMFGVIYLVILILSLMIGLLGRRYLTMSVAIWNHDGIRLAALAILIVAYFVMLVAMVVVTFVVILQRFYKNLLEGEGYLMHTLPVPTWMLVASKLIAAVIWDILGFVIIILSLAVITFTGGVFTDAMPEISSLIQNLLWIFDSANIGTAGVTANALLNAVFGILMFYLAMAIGGSAKRHKKTCSILAFIVIVILFMAVQMILLNFWGGMLVTERSMLISDTVITAICCAAFFGLSTLFLQKRLNLE